MTWRFASSRCKNLMAGTGVTTPFLLHFIPSLSHCLPLIFVQPEWSTSWLSHSFISTQPPHHHSFLMSSSPTSLNVLFSLPWTLRFLCSEQFLCCNSLPHPSSYSLSAYSAQPSVTISSRHPIPQWVKLADTACVTHCPMQTSVPAPGRKFTELTCSQNSLSLLSCGQGPDVTVP